MKCNADKGGVDIKSNSKPIFAICVSLKCSINYPYWRRYVFLSHLITKSKISISCVGKTGRRYGQGVRVDTIVYASICAVAGRHCVSSRRL